MVNRISAELSAEALSNVKKKIADIRTELSFLKSLTKDERINKQNMGQGGVGFGKSALKAAQTHQEVLPVKFDVDEFRKDVILFEQLQAIMSDYNTLGQNINDTIILLGQEIMEQSNDVYDAMKMATKRENKYKPTLDELSIFYKARGNRKTKRDKKS